MRSRKILGIAAIALAATLSDGVARPTPAACAMCWSGACYNSRMCFRDCMCLKRGSDTTGQCFSASAVPEGYSELR